MDRKAQAPSELKVKKRSGYFFIETKRVEAIRKSLGRRTPLGNSDWQKTSAAKLEIESTLQPQGKVPKKVALFSLKF